MRAVLSTMVLVTQLVACDGTPSEPLDGEVGQSTFFIDNTTDETLAVSFEAGPLVEPAVLATEVGPGERLAVFSSSGCFGCIDQPASVLASLTLTSVEAGDVIVELDPVEDDAWDLENIGRLEAEFTLTVE